MLAYCGIVCDGCPIYLATFEEDPSLKEKLRDQIARQCSTAYGMNMLPEAITDCDGCRMKSGRLFSGCRTCEIRKCASLRSLENCAFCKDYACVRLQEFFLGAPEAKAELERIRFANQFT